MGGVPWMYFVPYDRDVQGALDRLKEREFRAGRYHPVMETIPFLRDASGPTPGAKHASIAAARAAAAENGTRSVLDMERVATGPRAPGSLHDRMRAFGERMMEPGAEFDEDEMQNALGLGVVSPVANETLLRLYGTERPSRAQVADCGPFEDVDRGTGVYVVVYDGAVATEICFAGCSVD